MKAITITPENRSPSGENAYSKCIDRYVNFKEGKLDSAFNGESNSCHPRTINSFKLNIKNSTSSEESSSLKEFYYKHDIHILKADELKSFLVCDPLIFDIRPYAQYQKSRIRGAINACVPTTLLKRSSFGLLRLLKIINIIEEKKSIMMRHIEGSDNTGLMKVLIYDEVDNMKANIQTIELMCSKFLQLNEPKKIFDIYCLESGFQGIDDPMFNNYKTFGELSQGHDGPDALCKLAIPASSDYCDELVSKMSKGGKEHSRSRNIPQSALACRTPSNAKIMSSSLNLDVINGIVAEIPDEKISSIPEWLRAFFIYRQDGTNNSTEIPMQGMSNLFSRVEKLEKLRISTAISSSSKFSHSPSICSPSCLCPCCDGINYGFSKGIENGYKNRYTNVWPYEHSRVKLNHHRHTNCGKSKVQEATDDDNDDYINANYISYSDISNRKYIATQYPLSTTYEDFWKMVWEESLSIIICLEDKPSSTFSASARYFDDKDYACKLSVRTFKKEDFSHFSVRQIELTNNADVRHIHHLEYHGWPDSGLPSSCESLIKFIRYKNSIIDQYKLNEKCLVHCLAGCGRTGSFIAIDVILDCFHHPERSNIDPWKGNDLVYKTVQTERTQRISMVQTLDQYVFCYAFILKYVLECLT